MVVYGSVEAGSTTRCRDGDRPRSVQHPGLERRGCAVRPAGYQSRAPRDHRDGARDVPGLVAVRGWPSRRRAEARLAYTWVRMCLLHIAVASTRTRGRARPRSNTSSASGSGGLYANHCSRVCRGRVWMWVSFESYRRPRWVSWTIHGFLAFIVSTRRWCSTRASRGGLHADVRRAAVQALARGGGSKTRPEPGSCAASR